jgi:hypothetical protein
MSSTETAVSEPKGRVCIRFLADLELRKRIKLEAVVRGVTLNDILTAAVDKYLPANSK